MKVFSIFLLGTLALSTISTVCPLDRKFQSQIYSGFFILIQTLWLCQHKIMESTLQPKIYFIITLTKRPFRTLQKLQLVFPSSILGLNEIQANESPYL